MGSWVWVAVFVREDETASLLPRDHVDVTIMGFFIMGFFIMGFFIMGFFIMGFFRHGACAGFKIERGFISLIDEMMPVGLAGGKARSHPRRKGLLPGVGDERHLPLQHIDELVLFGVPVALGGPTARSKRHEIDAELRKLE